MAAGDRCGSWTRSLHWLRHRGKIHRSHHFHSHRDCDRRFPATLGKPHAHSQIASDSHSTTEANTLSTFKDGVAHSRITSEPYPLPSDWSAASIVGAAKKIGGDADSTKTQCRIAIDRSHPNIVLCISSHSLKLSTLL